MIPLKCRLCKYRKVCVIEMEDAYHANKEQESIRRRYQRAKRLRKLREKFKWLMLKDDNN